MATIADLADAMVELLRPTIEEAGGTISRAYAPRLHLEQMADGLFATVVPNSLQSERLDRGSYQREHVVDVAIQKRAATIEAIDALVALVEDVADLLWRSPQLCKATLLNVQIGPIAAPEHLAEKGVFTSVLRATYRQGRSLS